MSTDPSSIKSAVEGAASTAARQVSADVSAADAKVRARILADLNHEKRNILVRIVTHPVTTHSIAAGLGAVASAYLKLHL